MSKQQKEVRKQNRTMPGEEHARRRACQSEGIASAMTRWACVKHVLGTAKHACGWSEVSERGSREDIREGASTKSCGTCKATVRTSDLNLNG